MNPEQQRIAIAEACGWKNADHPDVMKLKHGWTMPEKWCMDPNGQFRFNHDRPDYLNDLNAMHEAEKFILSTDLYIQYVNYLFRSVGLNRTYYMGATPEVFPADRQFAVFHATASQRAEAFLRTIGKWEESK